MDILNFDGSAHHVVVAHALGCCPVDSYFDCVVMAMVPPPIWVSDGGSSVEEGSAASGPSISSLHCGSSSPTACYELQSPTLPSKTPTHPVLCITWGDFYGWRVLGEGSMLFRVHIF
jgi:hypothetical protein